MSTTAGRDAGEERADLTAKQRRILEYLREHADGRSYFKSRHVADDLGLSAKEVGANIAAVREGDVGLSVEKWGYSSGTTWLVRP
ncbi:MAG: hypothetical protein ABEH40_06530 [Haloferacaceae archaeon]